MEVGDQADNTAVNENEDDNADNDDEVYDLGPAPLTSSSDSDDEQLNSNLEEQTFRNILAVLVGRRSLDLR